MWRPLNDADIDVLADLPAVVPPRSHELSFILGAPRRHSAALQFVASQLDTTVIMPFREPILQAGKL